MSSNENQIARVYWQMGQGLLPEHFYAQEQTLRDETNIRLKLNPYPSTGLGSVKWDSFQIIEGILSVQELLIVLPSGVLIDIPGNTRPASLNLHSAGSTEVAVYVHLESGFEVMSSGAPGGLDEENVERVIQKVTLSSMPNSDTAIQTFKLAVFVNDPQGGWTLSPSFVPPTVRIGTSPFYDGILERVQALLTGFHQTLLTELDQQYLSGESILSAKQCLRGVYQLSSILANASGEICYHPYELFRAIESFYMDVCIYREAPLATMTRQYQHEKQAEAFWDLMADLEEQLRLVRNNVPYVAFRREEGVFICDVPEVARTARQLYLLVQKPSVGADAGFDKVKLAAPNRVNMIHQRALRGINFEKVVNPPFRHNFSSGVEFYRLSSGEEWDFVVREGQLGFFVRPGYEQIRAFLYWRED